jgi:ATP-dependent DNA helicase RecG
VELRPDAVIVTSPGGLPEPVTIQNIREQNSARNISLIDSLRRFRLAEDAGRGVDVMQDTMQAELLDEPVFTEPGSSVSVKLPLNSTVTPEERAWIREVERRGEIKPGDPLILVTAARGRTVTNAVARRLLKEDSVVARTRLQRLCDAGFLTRYGERAGSQYALAAALTPPLGVRFDPEAVRLAILDLAREGPIDNAQVRQRTGLERHQAATLLNQMVRDGELARFGERRGTRYVLPGGLT